jgi:hypothetical protein
MKHVDLILSLATWLNKIILVKAQLQMALDQRTMIATGAFSVVGMH